MRSVIFKMIFAVSLILIHSKAVIAKSSQEDARAVASVENGDHPAYQRLRKALSSLNAEQPVSGTLKVAFSNVRGEGKKRKEEQGSAEIFLSHGAEGLVTTYSSQLLNEINAESEAKIVDEDAKMPKTSALNGVSMSSINRTLSPIPSISRFLKSAKLKAVSTIEESGEVETHLHFVLPMEAVIDDKETRGYVDDFEGTLVVTTDDNGVPLSLKTKFSGDGRAYVFFKVSASGSTEQFYDVVKGRLVTIKREVFARYETTFGDGESYDLVEFMPTTNQVTLIEH